FTLDGILHVFREIFDQLLGHSAPAASNLSTVRDVLLQRAEHTLGVDTVIRPESAVLGSGLRILQDVWQKVIRDRGAASALSSYSVGIERMEQSPMTIIEACGLRNLHIGQILDLR